MYFSTHAFKPKFVAKIKSTSPESVRTRGKVDAKEVLDVIARSDEKSKPTQPITFAKTKKESKPKGNDEATPALPGRQVCTRFAWQIMQVSQVTFKHLLDGNFETLAPALQVQVLPHHSLRSGSQ